MCRCPGPLPFESAIIDICKRRECQVDEALIVMYLTDVSLHRVEDITEALWVTKASVSLSSKLNKQVYRKVDQWRSRKHEGWFPFVNLDGIVLTRTWSDEIRNFSIQVAFRVSDDGHHDGSS